MTKLVIITGGAGFIGYHLAAHLRIVEPDAEIALIDNYSRGVDDEDLRTLIRDNPLKIWRGDDDLREPIKWAIPASFDEIDVYHLAAVNGTATFYERPADVLRTNLLALISVLDFTRALSQTRAVRILFASSNEAYASSVDTVMRSNAAGAPCSWLPTPESIPLSIADVHNPRWSYGGSKLAGELLVNAYALQHDLNAVIVRPHNFYGPRSGNGHVIPQMLRKIWQRTDPFPIPGYDQTRSFCHVRDGVRAMTMSMAKADKASPIYHIGTATEIAIGALARRLFGLTGWHPRQIDGDDPPQGSVNRRVPDTSKIVRDLGWEPHISLDVGLAETHQWYLREFQLESHVMHGKR